MEPNEQRQQQSTPPTWGVRLVQWLRWLLKLAIWQELTALLDRMGFTPSTVQLLCIDQDANRVLVLRTAEYASGYAPVQGLRRGALSFGLVPLRADVREDARRELLEEAVTEAPPLIELRVAERYREGRYRQFDCTVVVLFCRMSELRLRAETGQGEPCWLPLNAALAAFGNKTLRDMLADWRDAPVARSDTRRHVGRDEKPAPSGHGGLCSRRFLIGPPDEVQGPAVAGRRRAAAKTATASSAALDRFWEMPLLMLDAARALGPRGFDEVYQADRRFATELWAGMSFAARDCYRPDPRLWRDCRVLDARRVPDLLRGWLDARIERLAGDSYAAEASSIPGWASPETALTVQARSGCEISVDLIYDSRDDRIGCFLTRGGIGGITSDVLLYALMSERYLPIPVFHTHPSYRTETGYKQASVADFWVMGSLYYRLNGVPVGDCVVFPDGTFSEYGISGHGRCFFRRTGDPLLPPEGEPVATFIDVSLPERSRSAGRP
jgi:hypothetical protein